MQLGDGIDHGFAQRIVGLIVPGHSFGQGFLAERLTAQGTSDVASGSLQYVTVLAHHVAEVAQHLTQRFFLSGRCIQLG